MSGLCVRIAVADPGGIWTPWSVWKNCSAPCGGGTLQMRRWCLNGSICNGGDSKNESCNEEKCSGNISFPFEGFPTVISQTFANTHIHSHIHTYLHTYEHTYIDVSLKWNLSTASYT